MRVRRGRCVIAFAVVMTAAAACSRTPPSADRVGNPPDELVLTVGTAEHPDSPAGDVLDAFAAAVADRSGERVRIEPAYEGSLGGVAWDQRTIQRSADGDLDAVLARAGAWHSSGVTTLDALQLPGLVDGDEQADRLARDPDTVAALLAGLATTGFTGLGLYPEAPRYLIHLDGQTEFDADALAGRTIRSPLSETVFAVARSAGLDPVDLSAGDFLGAVSDGDVSMTEGSLSRAALSNTTGDGIGPVIGANLPLYTKFLVLAVRTDRVDADTRQILVDAADDALVRYLAERTHEPEAATAACDTGVTLVAIAPDDRAALMTAVQPVIDAAEAGPDGALVGRVRAAAGPPVSSTWTCPPNTTNEAVTTTAASSVDAAAPAPSLPPRRSDVVPVPGSLPDGIYRFEMTAEALRATGAPAEELFVGEWVLEGGHAELHYFELDGTPMAGEPPDVGGVYQVEGDHIVFATPPERAIPGTSGVVVLRWHLEGDTLTLTQVDGGRLDADFYVPWVRVGDAGS